MALEADMAAAPVPRSQGLPGLHQRPKWFFSEPEGEPHSQDIRILVDVD